MRYFVAVDIQNLWYSCRHAHGNDHRVDYKRLQDLILDIATEEGDDDPELEVTAYIIVSAGHDQTNFITALRQLNFNVKKRHVFFDKKKKSANNSNWDVGITADAFANVDDYDVFVLVSGDGDFIYLIEPLKDKGKDVYVISFPDSLATSLSNAATKTFHIDDDVAYSPRTRFDEEQRKRSLKE